MNCTHGIGCFILAAGDICPVCRTIVAARPSGQATRGEVGGGRAWPEPAPRTFAASAPTPATSPQHALPGRGTSSANAHHGADAAPSLLDLLDATPRARVTDPDTAHQAAGFQAGKLRESHRLVLTTLSLAPLTDFELGARTGKAQTSIGCRRGELTRAGMVADTGNTRPAPSGAPAAVWAITDLGRQALAREQARSNAA